MGRGVSSGGGKSSLGYLFGSDVPPRARPNNRAPASVQPQQSAGTRRQDEMEKPAAGKVYDDGGGTSLDMSVGGNNTLMGRNNNNYYRADGQNSGNFITVSLLAYISSLSMGIIASQSVWSGENYLQNYRKSFTFVMFQRAWTTRTFQCRCVLGVGIRSNINCACSKVFFTHNLDALCCSCSLKLLCSSCLTLYCPNNYLECWVFRDHMIVRSEKKCWGNELYRQTSKTTLTLSRFPFYFPHMHVAKLVESCLSLLCERIVVFHHISWLFCKLEFKILDWFDEMDMKSSHPLTKAKSTYMDTLSAWDPEHV